MGLLLSHTFTGDVTAQWGQTDPPADITVSEYLDLFFQVRMDEAHYVKFIYRGDVSQGIVYVIYGWSDEWFSQLELRRAIRRAANTYVQNFDLLRQWATVRNRWFPSEPRAHFVIRHVRHSDTQETLAVTLDGETSFDPVDFWKAEQRVTNSGGNWSALRD